MIHVPWWMQLAVVALQAYGKWKAGDGWAHGWLIDAAQTLGWLGFATVTHQWLLLTGLVLVPVQLRNSLIRPRPRGGEAHVGHLGGLRRGQRARSR